MIKTFLELLKTFLEFLPKLIKKKYSFNILKDGKVSTFINKFNFLKTASVGKQSKGIGQITKRYFYF